MTNKQTQVIATDYLRYIEINNQYSLKSNRVHIQRREHDVLPKLYCDISQYNPVRDRRGHTSFPTADKMYKNIVGSHNID